MVSYKNCKIKIPKNIELLYCKKKNIIIIIGKLSKKILKLKTNILIDAKLNNIKLIKNCSLIQNNIKKKSIKSYQGTLIALLKQSFLEVSVFFYKKIKLVGIGYKALVKNMFNKNFLVLKLGYSHNIYFKIPFNIKITCLKSDKIFILGSSYKSITQVAAIIRSYKLPEPYKGKGILYENEKILLKEGKKI